MYTFLRAQLDLDAFLPARVRAFFSQYVLHYILTLYPLTKRYVPLSEAKSCRHVLLDKITKLDQRGNQGNNRLKHKKQNQVDSLSTRLLALSTNGLAR